ncbi:hypothetical protein D3C76_1708800 [compost metagenome]
MDGESRPSMGTSVSHASSEDAAVSGLHHHRSGSGFHFSSKVPQRGMRSIGISSTAASTSLIRLRICGS